MGGSSPEVIRILENELKRPTDVGELAWSVPLGLDAKVDMISLSRLLSHT